MPYTVPICSYVDKLDSLYFYFKGIFCCRFFRHSSFEQRDNNIVVSHLIGIIKPSVVHKL